MKTIPAQGRTGLAPKQITTPLILDLLEWLAAEPRPYAEVMDLWRTSCPRLTVWEDAVDRGLVARRREDDMPFATVSVTAEGDRMLKASGRARL
jgi:hypothetical protein